MIRIRRKSFTSLTIDYLRRIRQCSRKLELDSLLRTILNYLILASVILIQTPFLILQSILRLEPVVRWVRFLLTAPIWKDSKDFEPHSMKHEISTNHDLPYKKRIDLCYMRKQK